MAGKRHKPEEIVTKLRQAEILTAQGRSVAGAIRSIGVTDVTYRWRNWKGGLKGDQVKRLKDIKAGRTRLPRALSDLRLDKVILAGAARRSF